MSVHHQDHDVTLHAGHVLDVLPTLDAASINCVVTSPPYFGLRDYGVEGQIGLEPSPAEYVAALVDVFREVRRVLRDDGVVWLNLGDSYSVRWGSQRGAGRRGMNDDDGDRGRSGAIPHALPEKNLIGIPWRVAFALQDDGWTLRNAAVWHKPNAMPESVTDRLSCRYESVFLMSKSRRYCFDLDPIREPLAYPDAADGSRTFGGKNKAGDLTTGSSATRTGAVYGKAAAVNLAPTGGRHDSGDSTKGRNPGDVWSIATSPFPGAHFATMPPALARCCILSGCPEDGVVLDPFTGSGTTGMVARQLGRRFVGVDLNPAYLDIAVQRIGDPVLDFGTAS